MKHFILAYFGWPARRGGRQVRWRQATQQLLLDINASFVLLATPGGCLLRLSILCLNPQLNHHSVVIHYFCHPRFHFPSYLMRIL